ncbi:MAG TPA: DUF167 domain-containing protein [Vicinamibacterales bacterium]|nr:DUF167 domain-containing protein [Vicinamibacterales bacterium]
MIRDAPDGVVIAIKVIPRAGNTAIAGTRDNALLIRLAAAPVDGAANSALVALLARILGVPARQIAVVAGEKSRSKRVKVVGVSAEAVRQRLGLPG